MTSTRPSPTSPRPSGSTPRMPTPTTSGVPPGRARMTSTRPSPTTSEAIRLNPKMPRPTATGATPGTRRTTSTRPSPTTTMPSGSIPSTPWPTARGHAWYTKKEYDKAIADCNEAIRLNPQHYGLWLPGKYLDEKVKSTGHRRLHRGDPARPRHWRRLLRRGLARGYKKEYDKANADFSEAIRLDPRTYGLQLPGKRWFEKGRVDKAKPPPKKSDSIRPEQKRP